MPVDGRKVRCSSCSNVWSASPQDDETPAPVESAAPSPADADTTDKLAAIREAMNEGAESLGGDDEVAPAPEESSDETEDKLDIEEEMPDFDPRELGFEDNDDDEADSTLEGGVSDPVDVDERFADDFEADDLGEGLPADDFDDDEDFDDDLVTRRRRHQREEAEYRAASRRSQMAAVGWVFLILFLGSVVGLFFMVPERIVAWWPAAGEVYDVIGVSKEAPIRLPDVQEDPNVEIRPYNPIMIADGDGYKLTLVGNIINNGKRSVTIPLITYVLSNSDDVAISNGSFCLPNRILRKSQSVEFEHSISPAPVEVAKAAFEIKWQKDAAGKTKDACASVESGTGT